MLSLHEQLQYLKKIFNIPKKKSKLVLLLLLVSPQHWCHIYDEIRLQRVWCKKKRVRCFTYFLASLWYHGDEVSSFPFKCTGALFQTDKNLISHVCDVSVNTHRWHTAVTLISAMIFLTLGLELFSGRFWEKSHWSLECPCLHLFSLIWQSSF